MSLLFLNEDELRQIVTIPDAIDSIKIALTASARGRRQEPGHFTLNLPEPQGMVRVMGSYVEQADHYTININSDFYTQPSLHRPIRNGLIILFQAKTGAPEAIIVDNGYLACLQTAVMGAVAIDYLAVQPLSRMSIIGADKFSYMHLKALMAVRTPGIISVWDSEPARADSFARALCDEHNLNITLVPSVEAATRDADLIICGAHTQHPPLKVEWLKPGVHINTVHYRRQKIQHMYPDVLQRVDVIITSGLYPAIGAGTVQAGLEAGHIYPDKIQGQLGELITGKIPGRTAPDQITLADLDDRVTDDIALAALALKKARFYGVGHQFTGQLS